MSYSLEGKSIVVTGAFGSLGLAVAEAVLAAGATVAAVDRADSGKAPPFSAGIQVFGNVDLASSTAAGSAFDAIDRKLGAVSGLVNVAGAFRWETVADGNPDTWDLLYNVNLRTAVCASKSALPHLLKRAALTGGARIVNIGALASTVAASGMGAYAASKAGVAKLTEALAAELKDKGITVNAVQPSVIDTAANRAEMPDADFGRWVKPQQIADLIVFLLSDQASAITGALIPIVGRV